MFWNAISHSDEVRHWYASVTNQNTKPSVVFRVPCRTQLNFILQLFNNEIRSAAARNKEIRATLILIVTAIATATHIEFPIVMMRTTGKNSQKKLIIMLEGVPIFRSRDIIGRASRVFLLLCRRQRDRLESGKRTTFFCDANFVLFLAPNWFCGLKYPLVCELIIYERLLENVQWEFVLVDGYAVIWI